MSKRPVQKRLFHGLALSLVILLVGGGIALLYQWHQGTTSSYASGDSVVGPPSLPAATVDSIFQRLGSPMVGTGQAVEAASRLRKIDDAFALAVWWTETNDGAAGVGLADRNPGSVRGSTGYPSAFDGYTIYPSYTAAVNYWFMMLKKVYIDRGLTTVSAISHPYVGTSTSDLWAGKVINLMQRYRAEAPPPTPTPAPTIAPDMQRQGSQLSREQQQRGTGKNTYYPPVVQTTRNTSTTTVTGKGLSGNARNALVLFALLLALALGLGAWETNRRSARRVHSAPVAPAASSPWEQLRASGQQPASFFNAFSGPLRTTDGLTPGLRTTEGLATTAPMQPYYASLDAQFGMGAFMAGQAAFQQNHTPQPQQTAAFASPSPSFFDTPATMGQQSFFDTFTPLAQQDFPFSTPSAGSWQDTPFEASPTMGHQEPFFAAPATDHGESATFLRPGLASLSRPPQSSLHRTRLQPASPEPQPVGAASGGGLLSRYREMQTRGEQGS